MRMNGRPVEAEFAHRTPVGETAECAVDEISHTPSAGLIEVNGATARTNAFVAHAENKIISGSNNLNQNCHDRDCERKLISNTHIQIILEKPGKLSIGLCVQDVCQPEYVIDP
jgi:hypothetical protein